MEGTPEALRVDPSPIAQVDTPKILTHYDAILRAEMVKPIVMGHSFSGAFTTNMSDRGLCSAAVSVDGAQVKGILKLPASTVKSSFGVLKNPLNRGKVVPFTKAQFKYAFVNTMTQEESDARRGRRTLLYRRRLPSSCRARSRT